METKQITYCLELNEVLRVALDLMPSLSYHNKRHAKDVYLTVLELADRENINFSNKTIIGIAAAFHDVAFKLGSKYNEERSVEALREYASGKLNYQTFNEASKLILATKSRSSPTNLLRNILYDADLANLGRKDFFERGEEVRQELLMLGNDSLNDNLCWYKSQLNFLKNHNYYTVSAQRLYDEGKKENIKELKRRIRFLEALR